MGEESNKNKAELLEVLTNVEVKAPKLEAMGQEIVRAARQAKDAATFEREVISRVPNDDSLPKVQWEFETARWRDWDVAADVVLRVRSDVRSFVAVSTAAYAGVSLGAVDCIQWPDCSETDRKAIEHAALRLHQVVDRPMIAEEARLAMRRLSLDVRSAPMRPPIEHFEEALGAIERPILGEGGPVSVLVTLRECIDAAVTEMMRRRRVQEPAKTFEAKILSLGQHCGLPSLPDGHFDRLAADGKKLMDDLSAGKQHVASRERLIELFNDGVLYLKALLDSIDAQRLRVP